MLLSALHVLVLLFFCVLRLGLTNNFNSRSPSEWRRVWHTERHRRCYRELHLHMDTVCSNDIYKTSKRSQPLKPRWAEPDRRLVRVRRGIMDECCSASGCSWEEYAEYCPTNRRTRTRK